MNDGIKELAKMLRERENVRMQGIGVGVVVGLTPIKITFNTLLLTSDRLVIAKRLKEIYSTSLESVGDHGTHNHSWNDSLSKGDKVIIIPSEDNSKYYVIDKVG